MKESWSPSQKLSASGLDAFVRVAPRLQQVLHQAVHFGFLHSFKPFVGLLLTQTSHSAPLISESCFLSQDTSSKEIRSVTIY